MGLCGVSCALAQHEWTVPELQWLSQADELAHSSIQLTSGEKALLKQTTAGIINECVKDPGPWDPKTASGMFALLRVRRVAMAPNGEQGLIVQGNGTCMCGAVGNCPFWLVTGKSNPRVILDANGIQTFGFQRSTTASHYDLILGRHDSAMATDLQQYRFDGKRYRRQDCALAEWADEMGNALPKPRITSRPCS
jgi:hypothetical protein